MGLMLVNQGSGLGNCKYNGEGYKCLGIILTHPSHHTVENIQADAEVIAYFSTPYRKVLCMSALIRANTAQSSSTEFFNAFVKFASSEKRQPVKMTDGWNLNMMVPPNSSYFVYDGSTIEQNCQKAKWIVFKNMINIDTNDFALLVKNSSQPLAKPIQPIGDREVFFNSTEKLGGAPAPKNTFKVYRYSEGKLTPIKNLDKLDQPDDVKEVKQPDVKSTAAQNKSNGILDSITSFTSNQVEVNGIISFFDVVLLVIALYYGYVYGKKIEYRPYGVYLINLFQYFGAVINSILFKQPSAVTV
jgi:hypothetical protein